MLSSNRFASLQGKQYLGLQNLGCHCKILGCHFDQRVMWNDCCKKMCYV